MALANSCTVSAQPLQPAWEEHGALASRSPPSPLEEAIASLALPLRKGIEMGMLPVSSFAVSTWFALPVRICVFISRPLLARIANVLVRARLDRKSVV